MTFIIRPLQAENFPGWLPLWDANNLGTRNVDVTTQTWARLMDPGSTVKGLCAVGRGEIMGLVHYILHPTTGAVEPACYMQDVFVDPEHRRKGNARALVQDVVRIGLKSRWSRLYWLAEADNQAAQALYKTLGVKLDFTLHVMPLGK